MTDELVLDMEKLHSLHRFGDILAEAVGSIISDTMEITAIRTAIDGVGPHWYGMRCGVKDKLNENYFYLHMGLIFHSDTHTGMMVELDYRNNPAVYEMVKNNIKSSPNYEVIQEEKEYLKLFMPDVVFEGMQKMTQKAQQKCLASYITAAAEAITAAAKGQGFLLNYEDLHRMRELIAACKKTIKQIDSRICSVDINEKDPDNFGNYACGYRYNLNDLEHTISFYAYFGIIYSYKKRPCGIFAEIDRFSNKDHFDLVFDNISQSDFYDISKTEPDFLKLFMTTEENKRFQTAGRSMQQEILNNFFRECSEHLIIAYQKGKNDER